VTLNYNGTTLSMSMYDVTAGGSCPGSRCFTQSWTVNIPALVGGNTAYLGFTGGINGNPPHVLSIDSVTYNTNAGSSASTPTLSPVAGSYPGPQLVTISDATAGAIIYYTTDGTTPLTSSSVYSSPITVSSTETIEAIAVKSGYNNSSVASATYVINKPPQIGSLSANYGALYAIITISGTNFGATQGSSTVTFNGVAAPASIWSNTSIQVNVPYHASTGNLVVAVGGLLSNEIPFTLEPTPVVTGMSPATGPAGTLVTISGQNLLDAEGRGEVWFGGISLSILNPSNTSLQVVVPDGAATGTFDVHINGVGQYTPTFTMN